MLYWYKSTNTDAAGASAVCQNLRRLRERGAYYNFGQIACVAVRSPPEEQYVVEHGGARFARFYVLDGQHRLRTMEELARERPNIPIWFELSVRVVQVMLLTKPLC